LKNIANNVTELIGKTPLIKLQNASQESGAFVVAKCEFMNPNGSVKDRIGKNMILQALEEGKITKDTTIIEPTSGNTGIALASVCAALGMKLILTMPESMSIERRKLLQAYGAKLVLTPAKEGMQGSIDKAVALQQEIQDSVILQQFENPHNPQAHTLTTAQEILEDMEHIDIFVSVVGTGGTLSGTAKVLKQKFPHLKVVAVEPKESPLISSGKAAPHKIQGIGANFIPKNYDSSIVDEVVCVSGDDAIATAKDLAQKEGLLVGISSGANVYAATQIAKQNPSKIIVTILCDTGERYLSTELFESEGA